MPSRGLLVFGTVVLICYHASLLALLACVTAALVVGEREPPSAMEMEDVVSVFHVGWPVSIVLLGILNLLLIRAYRSRQNRVTHWQALKLTARLVIPVIGLRWFYRQSIWNRSKGA